MSPASTSMRFGSISAAAAVAASTIRGSTSATTFTPFSSSSRATRRRPMKPGNPVSRSVGTRRQSMAWRCSSGAAAARSNASAISS